jgi:hypothetical protein
MCPFFLNRVEVKRLGKVLTLLVTLNLHDIEEGNKKLLCVFILKFNNCKMW